MVIGCALPSCTHFSRQAPFAAFTSVLPRLTSLTRIDSGALFSQRSLGAQEILLPLIGRPFGSGRLYLDLATLPSDAAAAGKLVSAGNWHDHVRMQWYDKPAGPVKMAGPECQVANPNFARCLGAFWTRRQVTRLKLQSSANPRFTISVVAATKGFLAVVAQQSEKTSMLVAFLLRNRFLR